jgi:hypothetical protein
MKRNNVREILSIAVFSGKDVFPMDLEAYDKVVENCREFESSVSVSIDFYKDEKIVRRMWNPSCDISYKKE